MTAVQYQQQSRTGRTSLAYLFKISWASIFKLTSIFSNSVLESLSVPTFPFRNSSKLNCAVTEEHASSHSSGILQKKIENLFQKSIYFYTYPSSSRFSEFIFAEADLNKMKNSIICFLAALEIQIEVRTTLTTDKIRQKQT